MRPLAIGIIAAAAATADADPAVTDLAKSLPVGWHLQVTGPELAITRDAPVQLSGRYHENAARNGNNPAPSMPAGPSITLAVRYRIAPKWSAAELATAKAANDKVGAQLRALADKYQIDTINKSKGRPLPVTPDEQRRLEAYELERARVSKQLVALPRCTLGASSVFDEGAYSQLDMIVDPPSAMRELFAIVELVKRRCQ